MNALVNTNELKAERIRQGKDAKYMDRVINKGNGLYGKKERGAVVLFPDEMLAITIDLALSAEKFNLIFFDNKLPFSKSQE